MNAPVSPAAGSPPAGRGRLSAAMTAHPIRWLLGASLASAAIAAGAVVAIDRSQGAGPGDVRVFSAVGVGRVGVASARVPDSHASTADLGKLWGLALRGRAVGHESLARTETQADALPVTGIIDRATNTLRLTGHVARLSIVANPPNGRDMAFRIAGLENPTIEVRRGTRVTVRFINGDNDSAHGWMLLDPVVQVGGSFHGPRAFAGSAAPILGDPTAAGQPLETIHFVAGTSGSYRYECPVPGHAAMGMRGVFKVTA